MVKRYLVTDYDNCASVQRKSEKYAFLPKASKHLLSIPLVNFAKKRGYDGFYGNTHRCYGTDRLNIETHIFQIEKIRNIVKLKQQAGQIIGLLVYPDFSDINVDDEFVSMITKNFSEATGLPCIEVSTPDDANGECGSGYKKILSIYESVVLKTKKITKESRDRIHGEWTSYNFDQPNLKFEQEPVKDYDENSKNNQLMQIVRHAAKMHPNEEVILDSVDDKEEIIENALRLAADGKWPDNVVLNIFSHDAFDTTEVCYRGTISKKQVLESKDSPAKNSLFSATSESKKPEEFKKIDYDKIVKSVVERFSNGEEIIKNEKLFKQELKACLVDLDNYLKGDLCSIPNLTDLVSSHVQAQQYVATRFLCSTTIGLILTLNQVALNQTLLTKCKLLTA
jgi:hypothetical protein